VLGEKHPDTAPSLNNLSQLLGPWGTMRQLAPTMNRPWRPQEVFGERPPSTAKSLNSRARYCSTHGRLPAARTLLHSARDPKNERKGGEDEHPETAVSLNNLGCCYILWGTTRTARDYLEQARSIRKKKCWGKNTPHAANPQQPGRFAKEQGGTTSRAAYYEQALSIYKERRGAASITGHTSLNNLANS